MCAGLPLLLAHQIPAPRKDQPVVVELAAEGFPEEVPSNLGIHAFGRGPVGAEGRRSRGFREVKGGHGRRRKFEWGLFVFFECIYAFIFCNCVGIYCEDENRYLKINPTHTHIKE